MGFSGDPRIAIWEKEEARQAAGELPPNWKQPPKRHHYVPELYLRRFAEQGRKQVHLVSRIEKGPSSAETKVVSTRDAAVQTDFYKLDTSDPRRAYEAEHILGVFEGAAGHAFN